MPEYLGPIAIPEAAPAGVFPLVPEFGIVFASEPEIAVHRFGHGETQVEQRFWLGPGARRITLRFEALNAARRQALVNFFQLRQGSYQPFFLDVAMPDGATVRHTVRFAEPALSLDQFADALWRGGVELIEPPQDTPSFTVTQTLTRFPSAELASTLLGQAQELIPLVTIGTDIHISDRCVSVGGVLYQPRLVDWDGISQALDGSADSARFRLGNADRVMTMLVNAVDLWKQPITFSLFHVASATRIDLWKGFVTRWSLDQAGGFELEASDGLFELNLPYPARKITRDEVKIPDQPVNVGGKKGISRMTATSVVNDTAYGRALKDIYVNDAVHPIPVECEIVAGRDESEFYAALGIVGRGPISGFATSTAQPHTLDGQPNHGPGMLGLRRSYGGNPVTGNETPADNSPDAGSHSFALDAVGAPLPNNPVTGTAFLQIRRTDEKGIQPIRPAERKMLAQITGGLGCWAWTAPGVRTWEPASTNPVWIAVNTLLRAKGLSAATVADQEALFDVPAAISAAQTCDLFADKIIGAGQEQQFRFTGIIAEERPLRDWLQEILGSCLGYFTFVAGKLRIGLRIHSSTIEAFSAGNILYSSLHLASYETRFNDLTAAFADVDYSYQQNALNLYDADHAARVGERLKANVNLVGVCTKSQAARLITTRLREELGGLTASEQLAARQVSFRTTVLALNTEPGMVCSMTHPDMPNGAGEFRLIRWRLNRDYSIDIEGRSTTDSMYDLTVGDKPTDVAPEPVRELPAADLLPGKVSNIELAGIQFDGLTAQITLRYSPPDPLGYFRGVRAYGRMPAAAEAVPSDLGGARFEPDEQGRGTIRVTLTQPAAGDRECKIWLCSQSAILTAPLSLEDTPSIMIDVQAATPVGEVPLGDVTGLAGSYQIKDGRVLIAVTGTAPVDSLFAGAEVFLEIPQESDPDPEHPTLPGQFYPQGWHFGESSAEIEPRLWTAKLDVPAPPSDYLRQFAEPRVTWVIYELPRSWGYANRLVRLTALDPAAPATATPHVALTLDFAGHLAEVGGTDLGPVTPSGPPVVSGDGPLQVAQAYFPPYLPSPIPSIGDFEGVEVVVESDDGSVLDRGRHPYTGDPFDPSANAGVLRFELPRPAELPATVYLHLMSYAPTRKHQFKKIVRGEAGWTSVGGYPVIELELTAESILPGVPQDFVVTFDGYHSDAAGVRKARIDAAWTDLPGSNCVYGLWMYEGATPPADPAQWAGTDINVPASPVTFWLDPPEATKRIWFCLVYQTSTRAYLPADFGAALPVASIDLPPAGGLDGTKIDPSTLGPGLGIDPVSGKPYIPPGAIVAGMIDTLNVGQLNGLIQAHQIGSVSADKITGQIAADQIGSIAANKITGVISAEQIGGIQANQITGAIQAAQIQSLTAAQITGVIVTQQLADGILSDLKKFSTELRPHAIVSALPSLPSADYPIGATVSFQGKVYRNVSHAWTASTAAADISGQLGASQIASVNASSIIGLITALQIQSVNASQISGLIQSSQIDSISSSKISGSISSSQIGSIEASKIAGSISSDQIGSLAASKITGLIQSTQIDSIAASKISGQISSSQIGSINATQITGQINVTNLTGTVSAGGNVVIMAPTVLSSAQNPFPGIWVGGSATIGNGGSLYVDNGNVTTNNGNVVAQGIHITGSTIVLNYPANWRSSLGLGNAAVRDVGTGSGHVAAGDHTHTGYASTSDVSNLELALSQLEQRVLALEQQS